MPLTVKMEETEGDSSNTSIVNNHQLEDICDNQDLIDDNDLPVIDQLEDITDSQVFNSIFSLFHFYCKICGLCLS